MKNRGFTTIEIMIVLGIIFVIASGFIVALSRGGSSLSTDPERTRNTLENQGFTDIQIGEYKFGACGEDDYYSTGFTATNPIGNRVSGVVCCGTFKGCTVRF